METDVQMSRLIYLENDLIFFLKLNLFRFFFFYRGDSFICFVRSLVVNEMVIQCNQGSFARWKSSLIDGMSFFLYYLSIKRIIGFFFDKFGVRDPHLNYNYTSL